jgi:hypothetical protein
MRTLVPLLWMFLRGGGRSDWGEGMRNAFAEGVFLLGEHCHLVAWYFLALLSPRTILRESVESANRLTEAHVRFLCRREIARLSNSILKPSRRLHKYREREQVWGTNQMNPEKPPSHLRTSFSSSARPPYASPSHQADSTSVLIWSLVRCSRRAGIDAMAGKRVSACVARGGCVSPRVARVCIDGEWAHERPFLSCVTVVCWV